MSPQINQMIFNYVWEYFVEGKWNSGGKIWFPSLREVARGLGGPQKQRMVQIREAVDEDKDMEIIGPKIEIIGLRESLEKEGIVTDADKGGEIWGYESEYYKS